jgi:hypothetical protein
MSPRKVSTELIRRRAAFDIGSGSTKFQCSDYSLDKRKILNIIFQEERPVLYGADYLKSPAGHLGLQTLYDLKKEGDRVGVEEYSGIATEVFRKATNGIMQYLQRIREEIGIPVQILTQEVEAEVGFISVTSFDENIDIVWDSGASSFQISTQSMPISAENEVKCHQYHAKESMPISLVVYMDAIGTSVANRMFVEKIRNEDIRSYKANINPVTETECWRLIRLLHQRLPTSPPWLHAGDGRVGAAAVNNSIFKVCCDVLSVMQHDNNDINSPPVTSFSLHDATQALHYCLNRTNDDLQKYVSFEYADSPNPIVVKLSLLVAVMRHTRITTVHTFPCVGACPGVLQGEQFW